MTSTHPVRFQVDRPVRLARLHVLIRLALLLAIGALGCSSIYWVLYLALPALVALYVAQRGGERYEREVAPRAVLVLRWLAGAYAYLWLLTDTLPTTEEAHPVVLEVDVGVPGEPPTPASALKRLLFSLPALLVSVILSMAAALVWLVAAVFVLIRERVPEVLAEFLELVLRYETRLVAYHLSLVGRYPALEGVRRVEHAPA